MPSLEGWTQRVHFLHTPFPREQPFSKQPLFHLGFADLKVRQMQTPVSTRSSWKEAMISGNNRLNLVFRDWSKAVLPQLYPSSFETGPWLLLGKDGTFRRSPPSTSVLLWGQNWWWGGVERGLSKLKSYLVLNKCKWCLGCISKKFLVLNPGFKTLPYTEHRLAFAT